MNPILKVHCSVKRGIFFSTWGNSGDGKLRQEELDSGCVNAAFSANNLRAGGQILTRECEIWC